MKTLKRNTFLLAVLLISSTTFGQVSHAKFDALLKKYVDAEGQVNYKGFVKDSVQLNAYLKTLSENPPSSSWSKKERLAYWINAYNGFTIQLIVRNYPVKSIKELGGSIYKINTPWAVKFIPIGDDMYSLDNIEHGTIRKEFNEPRIHFAVNCASVSCPKLRNEAYTADKLDKQLDDQASHFINNKSKNDISIFTAKLSKIFKWFSGDFKQDGGDVIDFINKYSKTKISKSTAIIYMDYDWNLNE